MWTMLTSVRMREEGSKEMWTREEADLGEDEGGGERRDVDDERLTSVKMREEGSEGMWKRRGSPR